MLPTNLYISKQSCEHINLKNLTSFMICDSLIWRISTVMSVIKVAMILLILCNIEKSNSSKYFIREEAPAQILKDVQRDLCLESGTTCPPWSYCDGSDQTCKCISLPGAPLLCHESVNSKEIESPFILDCYCISLSHKNNLFEVGQCDFNCAKYSHNERLDRVYERLPSNKSDWNNYMCGEFSRTGTLCGKCDEESNYYPRAYSFALSCIKCEDTNANLWKYISLAYLPLTIFYLLIFFLKVDIHSSQLQGFIIFSQYMSVPALVRNLLLASRNTPRLQAVTTFMAALYGVWNLDFFRTYNNGICFRISSLATLSLDLAIAVYPLLLMFITYILIKLYDQNFKPLVILWKPFRAIFGKWQNIFAIKTSIIDAYATFLFLTNAKLLSICLDILTPVKVYQFYTPKHVKISWRLYYDPNVVYLSSVHHLYAAIAFFTLFTFVILPVLILLLYSISSFQKFLNILPHRWQIYLHTFMDSFQGCYKDGTEPDTRDCRWYAPMFYISRLLLMTVYAFSLDAVFFPLGAIVLTILALLTIIVDPFKLHLKNLSFTMTIFILFIAGFFVCAVGVIISEEIDEKITHTFQFLIVVVYTLPLLYMSVLLFLWIISRWNLSGSSRR